MDNIELKEKILSNTLDDSPLVLRYSDNTFLSEQYVTEICKNKNLQKLSIDSLSDYTPPDDMFESEATYLYEYNVEKLLDDIKPEYKNLVVISKNLPDNLSVDYIDMTKIVPWQIEDFVKLRLPGLADNQIKWLCDVCKYDIYRLDNECKKLEIFDQKYQKIMFDEFNNHQGFCDLNSLTIFNFTNAIMKKDLPVIQSVLEDLRYIDIEGTGLITILHAQFKNLLNIQFNPKATCDDLGMNPKQYHAIRFNVGTFTNNQLIDIFDFITELDMRLKNGEFQFKLDSRENNIKFVEYITLEILIRSM